MTIAVAVLFPYPRKGKENSQFVACLGLRSFASVKLCNVKHPYWKSGYKELGIVC